ncbi:MAG TPA: YtpI family protein [Sporosarcina sp.]|nr:YtpI family protein [Sporosarcina sp.]
MLVFLFLACISIVCYLYFKMRQFRTTYLLPIRKKMFRSMAGVSLGLFLVFFGIHQITTFSYTAVYIVSTVFIAFGLFLAYYHFGATKHYRQYIEEEAKINGF